MFYNIKVGFKGVKTICFRDGFNASWLWHFMGIFIIYFVAGEHTFIDEKAKISPCFPD